MTRAASAAPNVQHRDPSPELLGNLSRVGKARECIGYRDIGGGLSIQAFPRWKIVNSIFQLPGRTGRCLGTCSACGTGSQLWSWIPHTVSASWLPGVLPSADEGRRAEGFSFPLGTGCLW